MKKTVAIVIPYYNGSEFIEIALESAYSQTIPADEIVVVNDGSTPEESEFIRRLQAQHGFKLLEQENQGQAAARNRGIFESTSKYICLLDQDDIFRKNHIELLINAIPSDDPHFGFVYGDLGVCDKNGNIVQTTTLKGEKAFGHDLLTHPKENIHELVRYNMMILPSATIISREAFDAVGGFDPQFIGYEDDDLFMRIFRKGYTNYFLPKWVSTWRMRHESTSFSIKMSRSRIRFCKKILETFPDEPAHGVSFFAQFIVPRFAATFLRETLIVRYGDNTLRERIEILKEFANMIYACPLLPKSYKTKFKIAVFFSERLELFHFVFNISRKIPIVRSIRNAFGKSLVAK